MSLRPSVRFEVFKRDGFTCQYCGRKTPTVVLEVDHIVPCAEGGGDDFENLVTACMDCNRGKGAGLLDDRAPVRDMQEQAELIRERERQLREYNDAKRAERERRDDDFYRAWNHWFDIWGQEKMPKYHVPWENVLRRYIDELGVEAVVEAMDITRARFRWIKADAVRYLIGVLRNKAKGSMENG